MLTKYNKEIPFCYKGLALLKNVVQATRTCLGEVNVHIPDKRFTPHMTLIKLGSETPNINTIPHGAYKKFKQHYFGGEEFNEMLLCSMEDWREDGFYPVLASVDFRTGVCTRNEDVIRSQWEAMGESVEEESSDSPAATGGQNPVTKASKENPYKKSFKKKREGFPDWFEDYED